jgi:hypothetical protein
MKELALTGFGCGLVALAWVIVDSGVSSLAAALAADVTQAFALPPAVSRGFIIICGVQTDDIVGTKLGIVAMLLAGLPAAGVAIPLDALARAGRWRGHAGLGHWFQIGFVVQGCSLTLAAAGGLLAAIEPPDSLEQAAIGLWLTATVLAGVVALPAWRRLQADAFRTIRADILRLS